MTKQSLIKGTIILTVAAFITKLLGFGNGIMLANILGPEGVGLMMMAMPIIGLLFTLTTLGLPLAIAKLVAEAEIRGDKLRVKKILIISLTTIILLSIVIMIGAFFCANFLSGILLTDKRAYYSFLAVIPMVPIIAISAVIKGYFRGKQNMTPIASSQVFEQVITIGFIFILVKWLIPYGIEFAAAGAVLGSVIGEIFSLLYILLLFKWEKDKRFTLRHSFIKHARNGKGIFRDLLKTGLPTTGDGIILSIIGMAMPVLITQSLALAGVETAIATKQFGILLGYAAPLILLPGFITHSLSVPLVPAISEAHEKNDHMLIHKSIQQAIWVGLIVGVPWTIIIYLFAEPLTTLIYKSPEAAIFVKIMAPFFLLHYFHAPLQAALIGLGKAKAVMLNNLVSSVITLPIIFFLTSNPTFGIKGVAIAMNVGVVLGTLLHFSTISRLIGFHLNLMEFVKVILSGIIMGCGGLIMYRFVGNTNTLIQLGFTLTCSLLIYLIFLTSFKSTALKG
ncbi:stage V sporulation protein B [Lederbergia lenta]|uniref:Stage V sporulation protein B n=1 Tax=Lederbergia lenta TaxID=1467 RepID=A0A2X4W8B8_LEDLE|nr:stage V sporulation protein B [Lederbergia lenta]MEC2324583.1 stage V sporulation protein B [Lederbergia lenta]SQI59401.1 stage V sporulation protein B [Lederbergia lenta]